MAIWSEMDHRPVAVSSTVAAEHKPLQINTVSHQHYGSLPDFSTAVAGMMDKLSAQLLKIIRCQLIQNTGEKQQQANKQTLLFS